MLRVEESDELGMTRVEHDLARVAAAAAVRTHVAATSSGAGRG